MSVSNTCAQMFITLQLLLYICTSIGTHSSRETACRERHTVSRHTVHLYVNQTLLFPDANMLSELRRPLPWLFSAAQRQTDVQTGGLPKARPGQVRLLYTIYNLIRFRESEHSVPSYPDRECYRMSRLSFLWPMFVQSRDGDADEALDAE